MSHPDLLGQLSGLQTMMADLLTGVPAAEAKARFHPRLASLGWYLGRSVYRELHWLRETLVGDGDLTARVRHLFAISEAEAPVERLPPPDHLLAWATEIQDEHLHRLATPGALPPSPLMADDRLAWFLLQERARDYEAMLWVLLARRLLSDPWAEVRSLPGTPEAPGPAPVPDPAQTSGAGVVSAQVTPRGRPPLPEASPPSPSSPAPRLEPQAPSAEAVAITQGHYRVGSRGEPHAYDNELPPQAVELANFRIARRPVTNAEYLGFMTEGGYSRPDLWDEAGKDWLRARQAQAPWHWRQNVEGGWLALGLHGPSALGSEEPVAGLSRHEARAFAAWAASLGGDLAGAVMQHEYQWEVAARAGLIEGTGRVWEWCANPFHPYPDFSPFPTATVGTHFDAGLGVLRGASLYTQRCLRRASFRHPAVPDDRFRVAGLRLVLPPT